MNPGYSEELSQKLKGANVLQPEKIIERINKLFFLGIKDLVKDFFIVVSYNLS